MNKFKMILSVLVLSLVFVGCEDMQNGSKTNDVTEETETLTNENLQTVDENEKDTNEEVETNEETLESSDESNEEDTSDDKVVEIIDDQKSDNNNEVVEKINPSKSTEEKLQTSMTDEMQKELENYIITLISKDDLSYSDYPKESLQAIAKYSNNESHGWVVRYGENKIGLAQRYNESNTGSITLFDGDGILKSEEGVIKNDSAEEYRQQAEKILQTAISGEAEIEYAY